MKVSVVMHLDHGEVRLCGIFSEYIKACEYVNRKNNPNFVIEEWDVL